MQTKKNQKAGRSGASKKILKQGRELHVRTRSEEEQGPKLHRTETEAFNSGKIPRKEMEEAFEENADEKSYPTRKGSRK